MVGAYGIGEVLSRLGTGFAGKQLESIGSARTELPSFREMLEHKGVFARSSLLGNVTGLIPGAGATIASFISYGLEAQIGRRRAQMGSGIAEGVVAPQAAATASVGGALVPLLALGIPGSGATAIILGAFMLHGIQPGPHVLVSSSEMVYTIFASLFVGLALMCVIGYFAIRPLVRVLYFPEALVSAYVIILCFVGSLSIRNNVTDLWLMVGFGILGYVFERLRFPIAPLVLGLILGPLAEEAFMGSMISSGNDWTVFFTRPIAGTIMALTIIVLVLPSFRLWRAKRLAPAVGARMPEGRP
jgi:putative tricarboxylic transport membrane protein